MRSLQYSDGLNPAQWESLRFLGAANRHSRTPTALAMYLGSTKGTAGQTLQALQDKGLVERTPDPSDRRATILELTVAGRAQLVADPLAALDAAVAALPDEQHGQLVQSLDGVLQALLKHSGLREVGVCRQCGHLQGMCSSGQAKCGLLSQAIPPGGTELLCVEFQSRAEDAAPAAKARLSTEPC